MQDSMSFLSPQLPIRSRLYRTLYKSTDFCSRQMLAAECGISMPTLYQNLAQLMDEGLVRYSGEDRSTGGRRAQGLDIVPDVKLAVGIAISERHLRIALADLRLKELAYRMVPFDLSSHLTGKEALLPGLLDEFLNDQHVDRSKLLGVGIALPGLVSHRQNKVDYAPTLGLEGIPFNLITRGIPFPVTVENDGTASGFAECFLQRSGNNLAYFSLEYGVGGAVLIHGEPFFGDHSHSGEYGHICVEPGGLACSCGKNGCLEAYCSAKRIETTFGISVSDFFKGVRQHVPQYEALLYDMLRHLAVAINNVHMVLDCDIVLGGFLSEHLQPYLPVLKQYVLAGNRFIRNADFIRLSSVRHHITPLGAALYYIREFVDSI